MGKTQFSNTCRLKRPFFLIISVCLLLFLTLNSSQKYAYGIGFVSHRTNNKLPAHLQSTTWHATSHAVSASRNKSKTRLSRGKNKNSNSRTYFSKQSKNIKKYVKKPVISIHELIANLQEKELMPGIVYKRGSGYLRLNVLDIDTERAPVVIKPIVASEGSTRLQTVKDHTNASHAIAAINANYFKKTGIPLGTLIIDGDWVAGPLYDRVALGISESGLVRIDRVGLGGILRTSNPQVPQIWINNINAPRRNGCRTIAYSRRWGNSVQLDYDGCLVSIDAQGKVLDSDPRHMTIPYGGLVLSDSKDSPISALQSGDQTYLRWQVSPQAWSNITQAVSGGPMLIKNSNYCINLKAESFRNNWTSNSIKARTACGVTASNHLLLVTAEGNHTLYDLAHILHELGAMDAMNLDGGGSTTMVIHDSTVNMESKSLERRVAVALGIFAMEKKNKSAYTKPCHYIPNQETLNVVSDTIANHTSVDASEEMLVQEIINKALNLEPTITAEKPLENQPVAN